MRSHVEEKSMFNKLRPQEIGFFDLFNRHASLSLDAGRTLVLLLTEWPEGEGRIRRTEELEHECDSTAHMVIDLLHRTFITPLDRDETMKLITKQDDVVDSIEAAAQRLQMYDIGKVPAKLVELAKVLVRAQEKLVDLVALLRDFKQMDRMKELIIEVQRLENEADGLHRSGLAELFRQHANDPMTVMKLKEIYEIVEDATDHCEDVAEIIEGIALEHI
jgi:predicted phosphate transport protein (TIGR00153 family)